MKAKQPIRLLVALSTLRNRRAAKVPFSTFSKLSGRATEIEMSSVKARQLLANRKQLQVRLPWCQNKSHTSLWLALRASVMRRTVSHSARPILRGGAFSVSVGRSNFNTAASFISRTLR